MSHTPHKLNADFPELGEKISAKKIADPHFARLLSEYNALNDEVHKAEADIAPIDDLAQAELRKKRIVLKDELYRLLKA